MFLLSKKVKVAVHDGKLHPDDVFSVAILAMFLEKPLKIFRTRDPKVLSEMDYVLDVGGEYNPNVHKFDHHQEGWNEKRGNGIAYATAGLVWKEYGEKICGSKDVADKIDERIIQIIDAEDNGIEIYKDIFEGVTPYSIFDYISAFNPTWMEKKKDPLEAFELAVVEALKILSREIERAKDSILGRKKVQEIYEKTEDKRILILDDNYSWRKIVNSYPEPLFIIKKQENNWTINTVGVPGFKFKSKLDFPESWAGKKGDELAKITGVTDAIFCHNKRFMCMAKSKEGVIALARLAIKENLK